MASDSKQETSSPLKLWRRAGRRLLLRGTDQILNFQPMGNSDIVQSMEWHELVQFRSLRTAMGQAGVEKIAIEGQSTHLLAATVLQRICRDDDDRSAIVIHDSTSFAATVEAMKALPESPQSRIVDHRCFNVPETCIPLLKAFHGSCDPHPSRHLVTHAGPEAVSPELIKAITSGDDRIVIFCDRMRGSPGSLGNTLDFMLQAAGSRPIEILMLGLVSLGVSLPVTTVLGATGQPPSIADLVNIAERHAYTASGLFFGNFDAGFLLPGSEGVELCLLHCAREETENLATLGFRQLDAKRQRAKDLTIWREQSQTHSYYANLVGLGWTDTNDDQTDWSAWAKERDWDPSPVSWERGAFIAGPTLLEFIWSKDTLESKWEKVFDYIKNNANDNRLSPHVLSILLLKSYVEKFGGIYLIMLFCLMKFRKNKNHLEVFMDIMNYHFCHIQKIISEPPKIEPDSSNIDLKEILILFNNYSKWTKNSWVPQMNQSRMKQVFDTILPIFGEKLLDESFYELVD